MGAPWHCSRANGEGGLELSPLVVMFVADFAAPNTERVERQSCPFLMGTPPCAHPSSRDYETIQTAIA
jgi:hypothetical protein